MELHSSFHKIAKIYESYGSHLGDYSQYAEGSEHQKISLLPFPQIKKARQYLPQRPIISVEDNAGLIIDDGLFKKLEDRFYIPSSCEGKELKSIIGKVNPKEVYIFGPYAKDYVRQLRSTAPSVKALFPSHLPSLF